MKLYFAGNGFSQLLADAKVLVLVTYALPRQVSDYWRDSHDRPVFLDSGAFTAFTQKKSIDIDAYIEFIKANEHRIETYAVLDVIGDSEGTKRNQAYMESKGLHPLPVYHTGSPRKDLEELIEKYNYIALGGLVPYAMNRKFLEQWFDGIFSLVRDKVKLHGLGMNAYWIWERYPFYSVDATSWLSGARYANVIIEGKKHTKQSKTLVGMKLHEEGYKTIALMSLQDYQREGEYVTKLWQSRGIAWDE